MTSGQGTCNLPTSAHSTQGKGLGADGIHSLRDDRDFGRALYEMALAAQTVLDRDSIAKRGRSIRM